MSLRFETRPPRRSKGTIGTTLRLGSMVAGLGLIAMMMQMARSPQMEMRLAMLLGEGESAPTVEELANQRLAAEAWRTQVDLELLESVDDDTPFRNEESDAWFHLLELARDTPPDVLAEATEGQVVYAQLLHQADFYRGRVITVRGIAHRIEKLEPTENEAGIDTIYRVWVQPGGTDRLPFQFHCLELPAGYSVGEMKKPIRCYGMFFKNRVYQHTEGIDKSPVLVGKTFEGLSPAVSETDRAQESDAPLSAGATIAVALAIAGVVVLMIRRSTIVPERKGGDELNPEEVAEELRNLEVSTPDLPGEPTA